MLAAGAFWRAMRSRGGCIPPDMLGAGQGKERAAGGEWGEEGKRLTVPPPATPAGL